MSQLESGAQLHERDPEPQGGEIRTRGDAHPSIKASISHCSGYTPAESKQRSHQPQNNNAGGAGRASESRKTCDKNASRQRGGASKKAVTGGKPELDQAHMGGGGKRVGGVRGQEH